AATALREDRTVGRESSAGRASASNSREMMSSSSCTSGGGAGAGLPVTTRGKLTVTRRPRRTSTVRGLPPPNCSRLPGSSTPRREFQRLEPAEARHQAGGHDLGRPDGGVNLLQGEVQAGEALAAEVGVAAAEVDVRAHRLAPVRPVFRAALPDQADDRAVNGV